MAKERDAIDDLLKRRRLTRAMSEILRDRMQGYLATLSPLLRPRRTFGDHVQGTGAESPRNADGALKELSALHERLAGAKPFSLRVPLSVPIRMTSLTLDVSPLEYTHATTGAHGSREVLVRSPFKWVLAYTGFGPGRLKELLASRQRSPEELHEYLVHYLVLHLTFAQQTGVTDILKTMHFPVSTERLAEFGDLPVTCIGCDVATMLPADEVIDRSAEISGMDAFEEIVRLEDVEGLRDPLKAALSPVLASHGFEA